MNVEDIWLQPLSKAHEAEGAPTRIVADGDNNNSPAWSAGGPEVLFSKGEMALAAMYRISADGSSPLRRIEGLGKGITEPALS